MPRKIPLLAKVSIAPLLAGLLLLILLAWQADATREIVWDATATSRASSERARLLKLVLLTKQYIEHRDPSLQASIEQEMAAFESVLRGLKQGESQFKWIKHARDPGFVARLDESLEEWNEKVKPLFRAALAVPGYSEERFLALRERVDALVVRVEGLVAHLEAQAEATRRTLNNLLWLFLYACVFIALGSLGYIHVVVLKRIKTLRQASHAIAAGDFSTRAPFASRDELGDLARDFNEMATRLKNHVEALKQKTVELEARNAQIEADRRAIQGLRQYAEDILASLPVGLIVVDKALRVLSVNRAYSRIFGLGDDQNPVGRPLEVVLPVPGLRARAEAALARKVAVRGWEASLGGKRLRVAVSGIRLAEEEEEEEEEDRLLVTVEDVSKEQRLREEAHAHEQRFHDLVQGLDAIVWEAEAATFAFTFVSQRAEAILGYPVEHWLHQPEFRDRLIHPEDRSRAWAAYREATVTGRDCALEYRAIAADGRVVWLRDAVHVVHDDSGRGERLRGVMVDITERKQAELELARVIRALKMLSRCNDALIRADSEERLLDEICRIAVEIGAYRMAWVGYALDDEAKTIAPKTHAGAEDGYLEQVRFTWAEDDPLGRGPAGRAIRSGEPVILPDLAAEESFSPWLEAAHARGFRGVVCLPLKDQDRTFGVLVLYQSEVCALQPDELRLLQELADDLAFGVVNLRARARERRTHEAVLAMARGVSASTGTEFFEKLTFAMVEALGAHAGFIAELKPPDQTTARTLCAVVANQIAPNFDYTLAGTPCEHVDQADVWVVPRDARRRYPQSRSLAEMGIEAYVGTKLLDPSGQPIGLMFVLFQEPLEQWEFISSTLKIFASRAAAELERLRADAKVREQAALLDQTRDAILLTDLEDRILFWNKGAERTYGWTAVEAIGKSCIELLHLDREQYRQAREHLQAHGYWTGELKKKTKAGTELTIECRWTLTGGQGNASKSILAIDTDITERKRAEARIEQLAFYDPLTGLPNRALFMDRLKQALASAHRHGKPLALLFLDLNRFKEINDTQGHAIGDHALIEVARRFQATLRQEETLARIGGDEFVVIAEGTDQSAAARIVERLQLALAEPLSVKGQTFSLGASIGIALYPEDGASPEELLKHADIAMYRAKMNGGGYRFYRPEMGTQLAKRLEIAKRLQGALEGERLQLHFQPQVDLRTGAVTGAEALVRWDDLEWGAVPPAEFIPVAQERGMMGALGEWVLRAACRQMKAWVVAGLSLPGRLAVNVDAQQLEDAEFVAKAQAIIRTAGLAPARFELELTESGMMADPERAIRVTQALKAAGFALSIDDFGAGYSSLAYLKRFAADKLKIDISFVRDMLDDRNDYAIVKTIIAMARSLGLKTLAEGVEAAAQAQALLELGCDEAQGYYFDPPAPADVFARKWLKPASGGAPV